MTRSIVALAMLAFAQPAFAATITIELPGNAPETATVSYKCDGGQAVTAIYVNATDNSLAVLKIGEETIVAANVLAGSGARYAGGKYIWWTKGREADLYDVTNGEDAPGTHCVEAG